MSENDGCRELLRQTLNREREWFVTAIMAGVWSMGLGVILMVMLATLDTPLWVNSVVVAVLVSGYIAAQVVRRYVPEIEETKLNEIHEVDG